MTIEIQLAPEMFELVDSGRKAQITFAGHRNYRLGPAELVSSSPYDAPRADDEVRHIEITSVRYCRFGDIRADDAHRDGFDSLSDLHRELRSRYSLLEGKDEMTIAEFSVTPKDETQVLLELIRDLHRALVSTDRYSHTSLQARARRALARGEDS